MHQPLINFKDYSTTGLIYNGIGCIFWVAAYVILVTEIRKKKFVEMPAYVAGSNIGWEFVWSFIYHPNTGLLYALSYQCAFFLDCYIFYALFKYGFKQPMNPESKKHFLLFCLLNFLFWILFCFTFMKEGYDTLNGAGSGYIINIILSLQCLFLLFQTLDTKLFSMVFAWCKMFGTGFTTISMFYFFPEDSFIQLLGVTCFILDNTYIYVLWQRHRRII